MGELNLIQDNAVGFAGWTDQEDEITCKTCLIEGETCMDCEGGYMEAKREKYREEQREKYMDEQNEMYLEEQAGY